MFTTKNLLTIIGRNAIITLVVASFASLTVWFFSREIERVANEIVQNNKLANTLINSAELFTMLNRDAAIVGTNDILIDRAFTPSDNILEFVSVFENLAIKNSVLQNFNFSVPTPSAVASPFPLSAVVYSNNLSTNILTLSSYLKDFESLPYFTRIESLNMSSQDAAGVRGSGTASFNAIFYAKTSE